MIQPVLADAPVSRVVNHSVSYMHASEILSRVVMRENLVIWLQAKIIYLKNLPYLMFIICTILYSCNGIRPSLAYGRSNSQYLFKSNHTVLLALLCWSVLNAALRSTIKVWYLDNVSKGSKMWSENTKTLLWRIIVTCVIMKATFFNTQRDVIEF